MRTKSYLKRNIRCPIAVLVTVLGLLTPVFADEPGYTIKPVPTWVAPVPAFGQSLLEGAESEHGLHDLLSDTQINGIDRGNTRIYRASEYLLTNSFGIENFSDIDISFDPTYQTLSLHELLIQRGEQRINRLDTASFEMFDVQQDEALRTYDSTQTLNVLLNDVRAGDVIRYSYSLTGENPVFDGNREFHINTELWTQLDRQYVRVLTASDDPLSRRLRGAEVSLAVKDKLGIQETIYDQRGVTTFETENGVPSWHDAQGAIVFSDMDSWQDVVEWAMPLYRLPDESHDALVQVADDIRRDNASATGRIGAALSWVQEEITFSDVELGVNSQMPSKPETTLSRGYGDSKDKAMLLTALLRELDVTAHAALVNTQRGLEAGDYPFRMHAFNHVVVHAQYNGVSHFIDPTRRGQAGVLGGFYEPNYGRALIISADSLDLVTMADTQSIVQQAVLKELTLPNEWSEFVRTSTEMQNVSGRSAELKVTSQMQGLMAEQVRANVAIAGERYLDEANLDYYQVLFPSISALDAVELINGENSNATVVERYSIDNFWDFDNKVGEHRWLYADEIIGFLDLPEKTENRKKPYEIKHPVSVSETWLVPVSFDIRMHIEEASIENEWVSFTKTTSINEAENQAKITFTYATLSNEVAARDLVRYVASVEEINDQASFYLQNAPPSLAAAAPVAVAWNTAKVKFWTVVLGMIYFTGWWLHFMKKYRLSANYSLKEDTE